MTPCRPDLKALSRWAKPRISGKHVPSTWTARVNAEEAACRAGGRRAYNAKRRAGADSRRARIETLLPHVADPRGVQSILARLFRVHRSTICKDFAVIEAQRQERCMSVLALLDALRALRALRMAAGGGS